MHRDSASGSGRPARVERPALGLVLVAALFAICMGLAVTPRGRPVWADDADAKPADETVIEPAPDASGDEDGGIGFPTDRLRERQLDRGRRLLADGRYSDAASLFDEILASDRDVFFQPDRGQRTWQSIKAETNRLIGELDKAGREAYELQFRARADRLLDQAIATDDAAGVVAVARRWFNTPAGHRATLVAAIEALEAQQPLAAAAWLDRLATVDAAVDYEPSLSIMRAVAWLRAGNTAAAAAILERARAGRRTVTRIAGKEVELDFPPGGGLAWLTTIIGEPQSARAERGGDWTMHRGAPARNRITTASRPLLAARYRVPLARHPEEARQLEARRRLLADQELPALPAATPLAVEGTLLMHGSMGLLAVDFETGKRIWMQTGMVPPAAGSGSAADPGLERQETEGRDAFSRVFEDATSGTLASDGRLVFVVESPPETAGRQPGLVRPGLGFGGLAGGGWRGSNTLSAYEIAGRGKLAWRLPARGDAGEAAPAGAAAWYLGAPLPVGDQLLVLVEERGEIRLDVLDAGTGRSVWSQPLAEIDEERSVDSRDSHARKLAGLSPALAEGVLVCPTGAGAVIAVDLATRTLLWAHEYPVAKRDDVVLLPNGLRAQRANLANAFDEPAAAEPAGRWLDSAPVLAQGVVLLTPGESQDLLCLDLRRGTTVWRLPRKDRLYVAGVVDGRAVVVGRRGVEAIDLKTGRAVWSRPLAVEHGSPSGRGILTPERLLLPLDTPEVLEIDLADGRIAGRAAARGGAVPGNLLAYRGEIVSQAADSLDVFHQTAALESRIDTAMQASPEDPWALLWRGQLDLERGDVTAGIAKVRAAHGLEPARVPADLVATSLLFALRRDFAQAAPAWRDAVALSGSPSTATVVLRTAVDGFLSIGDLPQAWEAFVRLFHLEPPAADAGAADGLVADGTHQQLDVAPDRWLRGRLADIAARAEPPLQATIDAFIDREAAAALGAAPAADRVPRLRRFLDRCGGCPRAAAARRPFAICLEEAIEAAAAAEEVRGLAIEREFVLLDLTRAASPEDREYAEEQLAEIRRSMPPGFGGTADREGAAWPIGKIAQRRGGRGSVRVEVRVGDADEQRFIRSRLVNVPVAHGPDSLLAGLELAFDLHQQGGIVATDGYGRTVGEPLSLRQRPDAARLVPMFQPGVIDEASVVGRVVFIRAGASVAAFELGRDPGREGGAGQGGGRSRPLWLSSDKAETVTDGRAAGFVMNIGGSRAQRPGSIPLGARISEPRGADDAARRGGTGAGVARHTGLPVLVDRCLKVHDPLTGRLLWERQRLPAAGELIGDDQHICVCPTDGRGALVLAMSDGRVVRTVDLPASDRRLFASGRRILTVEPLDGGAGRVRLDLHDPVAGSRAPVGEYAGDSRGTTTGDGRFAVVEPSGVLTVIDLETGLVAFRSRLDEMPTGMETVQVLTWMDRYLVFVGRQETAEEQRALERLGAISPLPGMPGRDLPQLVTGSLWAVDRVGGGMLWPVPATILRHSLQPQSGQQLPVLLFARAIQSARDPENQRLSVLCLDKRTGQAVYVDDRFNGRSPSRTDAFVLGCGMSGDPASHTIMLSQGRRDSSELQLEFTGDPTAPRPPFQATAARGAGAGVDPLGELEYWLKKAITLPLPF
jgi:outer membrane protein assembly factor BamB/tetratricopeptide (TPR) repeat protein